MTKFLNIFKKPCFCPIFGPFFQFLEQKNFSRKFGSVPHNFIWISSNIPNIRKKLMIQFKKKNTWTEGRKDGRPYFRGLFRLPPGVQENILLNLYI